MEFTHKPKTNVWESTASFHGRSIEIRIAANYSDSERSDVVSAAMEKTLKNWESIQHNIADSLLETYNDGWADPDDEELPELSRNDFLERITLSTIYVMEENAISLYFDDSDLFAGHVVEIFWTEEKMYEAGIEG